MMRFLRSTLSNLATLLLSLVLAVIIWFNALQADDPERTQFLQLTAEFIGRPTGSILVTPSAPRQSVQIVFQGPGGSPRTRLAERCNTLFREVAALRRFWHLTWRTGYAGRDPANACCTPTSTPVCSGVWPPRGPPCASRCAGPRC